MNLSSLFSQTNTWQAGWELVGWTMCYFLAVGSVLALGAALLRAVLRKANPNLRYGLSLSALVSLAALPVVIAAWLAQDPSQTIPVDPTSLVEQTPVFQLQTSQQVTEPVVIDLKYQPYAATTPSEALPANTLDAPANIGVPQIQASENAPIATNAENMIASLSTAIGYLPWLWLVGTPLTFCLLATGLVGSERLRRQSTLVDEGPVYEAYLRLRQTLAISRRVGIAVSERVAGPLLVGIVRPLILLPPAALTGWTTDEVEMVLLHELAHVRRWDNLVNFGQRVVESLLFFHPAVWWVSHWVRHDREECCDALVVAQTEKPQAYAELLVALAAPPASLAGVAMARHPLTGRIRRILKLEDEKMLVSRSVFGWLGFVMVLAVGALLWQPAAQIEAEETEQAVVEEVTDKEKTTEATEVAEELEGSEEATQDGDEEIVLSVNADVPQSTVNKIIEHFKLVDKDLTIRPNNEGIITLTRVKKEPGKTSYSTKRIEIEGDQIKTSDFIEYNTTETKGTEINTADVGDATAGATTSTASNSPFLSLEDQRAADLAYKLLNVEFGQLSPAQMQRVRAMNFEGGLRADAVIQQNKLANGMQKGDILVGLHVWPTKSLADVQKILQRTDIRELSPLKFYVIRQTLRIKNFNRGGGLSGEEGYGRGEPEGGGYGGEAGDFGENGRAAIKTADSLFSGRIEVNVSALERPAQRAGTNPGPSPAGNTQGQATPAINEWDMSGLVLKAQLKQAEKQHELLLNDYEIKLEANRQSKGAVPESELRAAQLKAEQAQLEIEKLMAQIRAHAEEMEAISSDVASGSQLTTPDDSNQLTESVSLSAAEKQALNQLLLELKRRLAVNQDAYLGLQHQLQVKAVSDNGISEAERKKLEQELESKQRLITRIQTQIHAIENPGSEAGGNPQILYDGRTFDDWRSLWKNELKTENRTEAIKALAAFGRAGYGKQAAEAILDVAEEYDFFILDSNPEGKLKEKVLEILTQSYNPPIPVEIWLPSLLKRYEDNPKRLESLVSHAIFRLRSASDDSPTHDKLLELANSDDETLRSSAIHALAYSHSFDPKVKQLAEKLVASDDNQQVLLGISLLRYPFGGGGGGLGGGGGVFQSNGKPFFSIRSHSALASALFHSNQEVRKRARFSLQNISDSDAQPIIDTLLEKLEATESAQDQIAVIRAFTAMHKTNPAIKKSLMATVEKTDQDSVKIAGLVALEYCNLLEDFEVQELMKKIAGFTVNDIAAAEEKLVKLSKPELNQEDIKRMKLRLAALDKARQQEAGEILTNTRVALPERNFSGNGGGGFGPGGRGGGGGFF